MYTLGYDKLAIDESWDYQQRLNFVSKDSDGGSDGGDCSKGGGGDGCNGGGSDCGDCGNGGMVMVVVVTW